MFCSECGKELPQEAQFCPECGTPVEAAQSAPGEVTPEPMGEEQPVSEPIAEEQPAPEEPVFEEQPQPAPCAPIFEEQPQSALCAPPMAQQPAEPPLSPEEAAFRAQFEPQKPLIDPSKPHGIPGARDNMVRRPTVGRQAGIKSSQMPYNQGGPQGGDPNGGGASFGG